MLEDRTLLSATPLRVLTPLGAAFPSGMTAVNGTVFFAAEDSAHGIELWKTDGTPGGIRLVKDIAAPTGWRFARLRHHGVLSPSAARRRGAPKLRR